MEVITTNTLREVRESRGCTQAEVAHAVGCDVHTLSRYENWLREPSIGVAIRLAAYYNIALEQLFTVKETKEQQA